MHPEKRGQAHHIRETPFYSSCRLIHSERRSCGELRATSRFSTNKEKPRRSDEAFLFSAPELGLEPRTL